MELKRELTTYTGPHQSRFFHKFQSRLRTSVSITLVLVCIQNCWNFTLRLISWFLFSPLSWLQLQRYSCIYNCSAWRIIWENCFSLMSTIFCVSILNVTRHNIRDVIFGLPSLPASNPVILPLTALLTSPSSLLHCASCCTSLLLTHVMWSWTEAWLLYSPSSPSLSSSRPCYKVQGRSPQSLVQDPTNALCSCCLWSRMLFFGFCALSTTDNPPHDIRLVLRQVFEYTALQRTIWRLQNLFLTLLDMIDRGAATSHILSSRVRHHAWDWAVNYEWRSVSRSLLTLNDVHYLQQHEMSLCRVVYSWARTYILSQPLKNGSPLFQDVRLDQSGEQSWFIFSIFDDPLLIFPFHSFLTSPFTFQSSPAHSIGYFAWPPWPFYCPCALLWSHQRLT